MPDLTGFSTAKDADAPAISASQLYVDAWHASSLAVAGTDGQPKVRAWQHPQFRGLAVTLQTGTAVGFNVTHVRSGRAALAGFGRWVDAAVALVAFHRLLDTLGIAADGEPETLQTGVVRAQRDLSDSGRKLREFLREVNAQRQFEQGAIDRLNIEIEGNAEEVARA